MHNIDNDYDNSDDDNDDNDDNSDDDNNDDDNSDDDDNNNSNDYVEKTFRICNSLEDIFLCRGLLRKVAYSS